MPVRRSFQCPGICAFVETKCVGVAVICVNAKIERIVTPPATLDGFDEKDSVADPELDRALIGFVAGIGFHMNLHDGRLAKRETCGPVCATAFLSVA